MHRLTRFIAVIFMLLLGGCERWALDQQMEELCKKDGGIKVYETVTLPVSDFNQFGSRKWARDEYYGPDYRYVSEEKYIVGNSKTRADQGDGNLVRWYHAIYRRADNKLLGEEVCYHRSGGDFFTFGFQPSGKDCPIFGGAGVATQVFLKGN